MIGFLVRGRVRIKIRFRVRVRRGVTFNVRVYHWSNCLGSKCHTFSDTDSAFHVLDLKHAEMPLFRKFPEIRKFEIYRKKELQEK